MSTLTPSSLNWPVPKLVTATIAFDASYPTGGETIRAVDFGLSAFLSVVARPTGAAAGGAGYIYDFTIASDLKTANVLVYTVAGFTPAGTNASSSVTGNVTVVGGGIGEATGINPDTNAGVLSKAAATNRTIPIATYLGAAPTAGAQTFTGTAVTAGVLVEVGNGVSLAAITALPITVQGY